MAVNKNFVVKNGLEVNDNLLVADVDTGFVGVGTSVSSYDLHVIGGIGATNVFVGGASTFSGIVTTSSDLYVGGDLYVLDDIVYDEVVGRNLSISGIGTIAAFNVSGNTKLTGITTLASAGGITTTGGDFYVGGDLYVLDDIVYDEVTGRNLNVTGVSTLATVDIGAGDISVTYLNVAGVATLPAAISMSNIDVSGIGSIGIASITDAVVSGAATFNNDLSVLGNLNDTGDISYDEQTARNLNVTGIATIATLVGYSSEFSGAVGFSSGGTLIGAAITTLNITGGGVTAHTSTDGTVQTVTFPAAGASIGLAIALGG